MVDVEKSWSPLLGLNLPSGTGLGGDEGLRGLGDCCLNHLFFNIWGKIEIHIKENYIHTVAL